MGARSIGFGAGLAMAGVLAGSAAWAQTTQPSKPYQNLFKPGDVKAAADAKARAQAQAENAQPQVNCTMRIIPADPSVDPKIRVGPRESDVRHTIRAIPPPCK